MAPLIQQLELDGVLVVHIDIDKDIATAAMHGIRSVPTLKFYNDDELVRSHSGSMNLQQLKLFTTP